MNKKRMPCFTCCVCSTSDCPNIQCDAFEEKFDIPCSDAGLERISCKKCYYNTGICQDCLFLDNPDYCPNERITKM